ncbi:class IV adenylate cyclase [Fundidesulfovibrio putealis]|uniref:class IV adenylate cyclase n=1 Tax=Fundidesulfovibrio putealis TaxID=270496 RepID=UPI0003FBD2E8|nr:class IV adenylate cyclase [Fundidesulfovibrio putealis]
MAREVEAKFSVDSLAPIRAMLNSIGAVVKNCRFERNAVFDTPTRELRAKGELLRLRQTDKVVLTWKQPSSHPAPTGVKVMDEVETQVADFEAMREILHGLGYVEALWYEKLREQWRLVDALVCLDVLPFGEFIEIEGEPATIAKAADCLGLDMGKAKALTYHDLYQEHLKRLGLPPQDSFIFSEKDKARLSSLCEIPGL